LSNIIQTSGANYSTSTSIHGECTLDNIPYFHIPYIVNYNKIPAQINVKKLTIDNTVTLGKTVEL
jgi:hypothetical protein